MFDDISGDYDHLNHLMSMNVDKSWRRRALKHIICRGDGPLVILDIACGTGDFSVAIARKMKKSGTLGHVTGLDLSEGMIKVMDSKIEALGLGDMVSTCLGDGENLPYPDGSFDRVTIAFGIRNFEDRLKGLKEMCRVLNSGGRLIVLELSVPRNPVLRWFYKLYFLHLLPAIGGAVSGNKGAYKYLPASVLDFPAPGAFMETIRKAGFGKVFTKSYTLGICRLFVAEK